MKQRISSVIRTFLHTVTVSAITLSRIFVLLQQLLSKVSSMENETSRISEHLEMEKVPIITVIHLSCKVGVKVHRISSYDRTKQRPPGSFQGFCSQPRAIWSLS